MTWHDDVLELARASVADSDDPDAVTGEQGFGPYTVRVPASAWRAVFLDLRDRMGCTYFDWLSAVDELADGFRVACHVARLGPVHSSPNAVDHLVVTTLLPRDAPVLESLVPVYAGAGWHERETHEMFGIDFTGGVRLETLLLPDEFEGHPLRKEFVLASRVAKAWPGAKEPGESDADAHASPSRRRQRPPGVPEPEVWGPREPGSTAPDPLAHARPTPAAARPRRGRRQETPPETPGDGDA